LSIIEKNIKDNTLNCIVVKHTPFVLSV